MHGAERWPPRALFFCLPEHWYTKIAFAFSYVSIK